MLSPMHTPAPLTCLHTHRTTVVRLAPALVLSESSLRSSIKCFGYPARALPSVCGDLPWNRAPIGRRCGEPIGRLDELQLACM